MPEFNFKSPVVTRKVRETELILEELEANNIIRRTTKQSVYVVNHEMIFKGSYSDFIKVYLDIYKEVGIMLDADGRVILDKSINYGKQ